MLVMFKLVRILAYMIAIRLGTLLLLATLVTAQDSSPPKSVESGIPKLPFIEYDACPGAATRSSSTPRKVQENDKLYSLWQDRRTVVGALKVGEKVILLAGVNVIREPDQGVVTQPTVDDPPLKPGDDVLLYGLNGDGDWNLWTKGAWHKVNSENVVAKGSSCGFADKSQCYIAITKNGLKEWWIQVKTNSGKKGWVLMGKTSHAKNWYSSTFGDLCMLD
jgi:hypothetical protein